MWVMNQAGNAVNLSAFQSIEVENESVYAIQNYADRGFRRYPEWLADFDNNDDAKIFIADLVAKLNAEKK